VTGAHADYWEAFRSLGITDRIEGHGRLMLSLSADRDGTAPLCSIGLLQNPDETGLFSIGLD
jgi:hypothetical protein